MFIFILGVCVGVRLGFVFSCIGSKGVRSLKVVFFAFRLFRRRSRVVRVFFFAE